MTTSHSPFRRANRFDHVVNWVLDHDGDIYGDERARLRSYERPAFVTGMTIGLDPGAVDHGGR